MSALDGPPCFEQCSVPGKLDILKDELNQLRGEVVTVQGKMATLAEDHAVMRAVTTQIRDVAAELRSAAFFGRAVVSVARKLWRALVCAWSSTVNTAKAIGIVAGAILAVVAVVTQWESIVKALKGLLR